QLLRNPQRGAVDALRRSGSDGLLRHGQAGAHAADRAGQSAIASYALSAFGTHAADRAGQSAIASYALSSFGTKQTCRGKLAISAFGGKADIIAHSEIVRL